MLRSLVALSLWLCFITGDVFASPPTENQPAPYDVIIRGGLVIDGSGAPGRQADVAIRDDTIVAIGDLSASKARQEIDAQGMVVAPGFINMLSWATSTLMADGRAQSDLRQGVTLEVFGEGWSFGPLNQAMREELVRTQSDVKFDVNWTSLAGYLNQLEKRGVSPNVASFVGATTVRIHVLGYADRAPTQRELTKMRELVRAEMEQGALGVGSSLIYAPAFFAGTDELIELCKVAAEYDGLYISHVRNESYQLAEAVDELLRIAREANISAEVYHLKAAGKDNWNSLDSVLEKLEQARAEGLGVAANIYPYTAGATGLSATMPPWVQEGGFQKWMERLADPKIRKRIVREMKKPAGDWENLLLLAGSPSNVMLVGFKNPDLKHLTGKTLAEVAQQRKQSAEETAIDLILKDQSRVETIYFMMDEDNIRKKLKTPWVSIGSDAGAPSAEGVFLRSNPHPRAYGSFAKVLGKYVRDEQLIPLELAIHKMTGLPARRLGIRRRGLIAPGYYADLAIFDANKVADHATYQNPHQYASGMQYVLVNGVTVIKQGEHTGETPGKVVRGPGYYRRAQQRKEVKVTERALKIHQRGYVFDGHNDLPWEIRSNASSSFQRKDISKPQPDMHTDIPRLKKGGVGAQFWSVYVPASTRREGEALVQTIEQIELVHSMIRRYPDVFELALTAADVERIRAKGKIASMIGMEGGHSIENSLGNLRRLYQMGARYMTLTHSETLDWADSATDDAEHEGLTPFGEEVVREMNRLGMLVDISHVSPQTMKDALRISKAPVIFSHSSARAVADHPRNVPDDVLRLTAQNGGVVMVNFFSGFVHPESAQRMAKMFDEIREMRKKYPEQEDFRAALARWRARNPMVAGTVHDLVDHIDHIVRIAGIDHVGIGSDYDGVSLLPKQLEDVSTYPVITQELLNRDYTEQQIHKIMYGNILRVLREAEKVADK